jgi:hypothetical protein
MSNVTRTGPNGRARRRRKTNGSHCPPDVEPMFGWCSNRIRMLPDADSIIDNRHGPGGDGPAVRFMTRARALAWPVRGLTSGDNPLSVRVRPSSLKRDCNRRTTGAYPVELRNAARPDGQTPRPRQDVRMGHIT